MRPPLAKKETVTVFRLHYCLEGKITSFFLLNEIFYLIFTMFKKMYYWY